MIRFAGGRRVPLVVAEGLDLGKSLAGTKALVLMGWVRRSLEAWIAVAEVEALCRRTQFSVP